MDPLLPYLAGFFDGEGSIGIYTNRNPHRGRTLRVQITQNVSNESTRLLQECRRRWGGSLSVMNRSYKRDAWNWQTSSASGVRFLREVRPWLKLKAAQADIALGFWDERGFRRRGPGGRFLPLSAEVRALGDEAEAALRAAKRGDAAHESRAVPATRLVLPAPQAALWPLVNVKGD